MTNYLKTINMKEPKSFAIFITWGGAGKTDQIVINELEKILNEAEAKSNEQQEEKKTKILLTDK